MIRELYKFDYGPKPGVVYDIEMGLITGKKKPTANLISLLQWMNMPIPDANKSLQERLSDNPQSEEMHIDNVSDSSDDGYTRFPDMPDVLYHPRAVNSPAAWIRRNEELLNNARRYTAELRTARGENTVSLRHSQSPTRLSDPYFEPMKDWKSCSGAS